MEWQDYLKLGAVERAVMGYPIVPHHGNSCQGGAATSSMANNCDSSVAQQSMKNARTMKKVYTDSPKKMGPYIDYMPHRTSVKPSQRPIFPCSQKNVDTFERQEQRDKRLFDAKAHKYRAQLPETWHHHHKPVFDGRFPEDHIGPDKGRHKPEWCRSTSIFDPITSSSRPIGSPGRVELRPSSAPHQRPRTAGPSSSSSSSPAGQDQLPRRPGTARAAQGRYNPLTHTWVEQPDPAAQAARQKESDRVHGFIGLRTGNSPTKGSSVQQGPDGLVGVDVAVSSSSGTGSSSSSGGVQAKAHGRSASAPRETRKNGDTWGTYDCLRHKWVVPPKDARFIDREAAPHGISFDRGSGATSHTRKVQLPANQGVYDPIRGQWKVLPRNERVLEGLEFVPRRVFTDKCFVAR